MAKQGEGNTGNDQEPALTVAPVVSVHYVGGSQVRDMTPADLRRVDPAYQGQSHVAWNADNRFTVNASEAKFTDVILEHLKTYGDFEISENGKEPVQVAEKVAMVMARNRPLLARP
jgi:hypothetical protein